MRIVLGFVILLGLVAGRAVAQPSMTPLQPLELPAPHVDVKDETTATLAALGATTLGYVLVAAGAGNNNGNLAWTGVALTVIGPSAGHIYAGENAHAGELSLVRAGGLLTLILGIASESTATQGRCAVSGCATDNHSGAGLLIALGGTTFVVATLYDLYDAHRAAARTNAREWLVTPTLMPTHVGGMAPAMSLAGRF